MLIRFGVIVVAWLAIISGIFAVLIGVLAALAGTALDVRAPTNHLTAQGLSGMVLLTAGLTIAVIGVAQTIFGVGLWQLRGWAVRLGIGLEVLTLIGSIIGLFTGAFTIPSLISTVVSGAILFVLLSPHVRRHIRQRGAPVAVGAGTSAH
ncbi:MAG TPA: hypothetical protein VFN78_05400 [Ktedonobacterales bacterium]|nr:hypothetical protein [Ktedonobacterales bacterium]